MQRMAAVAALRRKFAVVSGGPGTGKTTTVVRILALIAGIGIAGGKAPRIALAAPTGKAAARLRESVAGALERLDLPQATRDMIPGEAFTLHRLLGSIPGSPYFRHHANRRLPHDLVVVDESSMADMALMAKLVAALRDDAALIIVGDRDQLSSVEAGAVLGDICDTGARHAWSRRFAIDAGIAEQPEGNGFMIADAAPPLADTVVVLDRNYRFSDASGIGALRAAVRDGNHELALDILTSRRYDDIVLHDPHGEVKFEDFVAQSIRDGFGALMGPSSPEKALEALASFSVLCAHRKGPCGSEHVNRIAIQEARGGAPLRRGEWYHGQPLIVTRNSYALRLFNGDVGVVTGDGKQRAFFPSADGGVRGVSPSRLAECEPAYAITIHRSQGSEYDRVLVVLPEQASKVLTRELLYTAVTRARSRVELWGSPEIIRETVRATIERRSGLRDALWAADAE
jgi:exodeoxyribonuclease V alpha subunit